MVSLGKSAGLQRTPPSRQSGVEVLGPRDHVRAGLRELGSQLITSNLPPSG